MNRRQASQLLGVAESATALEANQAFISKLSELDERIQTAPSGALRRKYQSMRGEFATALQVMASGAAAHPTKPASDVEDLPGAAPVRGHIASPAAPLADASTTPALVTPSATHTRGIGGAPTRRWIWLAAGGAAAVALGASAYTGLLGGAWESIRPMSGEERLAAFQEASRLAAEIKVFQQRLDEARRAAETAVRDAQGEVRRHEGEQRVARNEAERTTAVQRLTASRATLGQAQNLVALQREKIFNGPRLIKLEGELGAGTELIDRRGNENQRAIEVLGPVHAGYAELVERLALLARRAEGRGAAEAAFDRWESWSSGKSVDTEQAEVERLRSKLAEIEVLESDSEALARYNEVRSAVSAVQARAERGLATEAEHVRAAEALAEVQRPASPVPVRILVSAEPGDAAVLVNGKRYSPATALEILPGQIARVSASAPGYKDATERGFTVDAETSQLRVTLCQTMIERRWTEYFEPVPTTVRTPIGTASRVFNRSCPDSAEEGRPLADQACASEYSGTTRDPSKNFNLGQERLSVGDRAVYTCTITAECIRESTVLRTPPPRQRIDRVPNDSCDSAVTLR